MLWALRGTCGSNSEFADHLCIYLRTTQTKKLMSSRRVFWTRTGQLENSLQFILQDLCSVNINNMNISINFMGFKDTAHLITQSHPIKGLDRHQEVKAARISRQSARGDGKVVSPTCRPPSPSRRYPWYSFLLEAQTTLVRPKVLSQRKIPMSPSGIEPATFRLQAQWLSSILIKIEFLFPKEHTA